MTRSSIHIGLVGCGEWGKYILRDLKQLDCEVSVVARSDESVARAIEGGAASIVRSISELQNVSGIVVCTPTVTHFRVIDEVLGVHPNAPIFVEKPLVCDPDDADILLQKASAQIFVMDKWRYHNGVLALREIAQSGELGNALGLHTKRLQWGNRHRDVNAVWILLPHDLCIAYEILGQLPEPRAAVADWVHGEMLGVQAQFGETPWLSTEVSARSPENVREVRLFCEKGVAVLLGSYSERIEIYRTDVGCLTKKPQMELRSVEVNMPLFDELKEFVTYVRGEGPQPKSNTVFGKEVVITVNEVVRLAGGK